MGPKWGVCHGCGSPDHWQASCPVRLQQRLDRAKAVEESTRKTPRSEPTILPTTSSSDSDPPACRRCALMAAQLNIARDRIKELEKLLDEALKL